MRLDEGVQGVHDLLKGGVAGVKIEQGMEGELAVDIYDGAGGIEEAAAAIAIAPCAVQGLVPWGKLLRYSSHSLR